MHKHNKFFKVFLLIYLAFLLYHASELKLDSWLAIVGLSTGIALAIVAHMRHGYGTIILLLVHMTIEWSEYASYGSHYSSKEMLFYGLHVVLDFAFLWQEAKTHLPRFRYYIMGSVAVGVLMLFVIVSQNAPAAYVYGMQFVHQNEHAHESSLFETVVIGGILGCTLSHLLRKKKRIHQNLQQ